MRFYFIVTYSIWILVSVSYALRFERRFDISGSPDDVLHTPHTVYDELDEGDTVEDGTYPSNSLSVKPSNWADRRSLPSATGWDQIDQQLSHPDIARSRPRPLREAMKRLGACFGAACKKGNRQGSSSSDGHNKQTEIQRRSSGHYQVRIEPVPTLEEQHRQKKADELVRQKRERLLQKENEWHARHERQRQRQNQAKKTLKQVGACFGMACKKGGVREGSPERKSPQSGIRRREASSDMQGTSKMPYLGRTSSIQSLPASLVSQPKTFQKESPPSSGRRSSPGLGDQFDNFRHRVTWAKRGRQYDRLDNKRKKLREQLQGAKGVDRKNAIQKKLETHHLKTNNFAKKMDTMMREDTGPKDSRLTKPLNQVSKQLNKLGACVTAACQFTIIDTEAAFKAGLH